MSIFINREQLYHQVWKIPMTKLAPLYNLSNYELKKICDRFLIPTPKAGYWAKLSFGKPEDIVPLPKWKICVPRSIQRKPKTGTIAPHSKIIDSPISTLESVKIIELTPRKVDHGIVVKKTLIHMHSLIEKTQQALKKSKAGEHGRLYPGSDGIAIHVSRENVKRSLLIMDAIFKWFESRGYKIIKPFSNDSRTFLSVDGIDIEIELFEKSNVTGKVKSNWGYEYNQYTPSGNITLQIKSYTYGTNIRTHWSDGKRRKVEDLLNSFIDSFFEIVDWNKRENERRERDRLEREARRIEQIYQEQCHQYENEMFNNLIQESNNLAMSTKIKEYVFAVEQKAKYNYQEKNYPKDLSDWFEWAKKQANKIDPLKDKWPSYIASIEMIDKSKIR
ncbi:MAG: hypothetical protein V2A75_01625 [Pseudomonadota bacterium]